MSLLAEVLLRNLIALQKKLTSGRLLHQSYSGSTFDSYFEWQFSSSTRVFSHFPGFDIRGKRVLEIGCGTGGRTAWAAANGASEAVGIDINAKEIEIAREIASRLHPELEGKLSYRISEENSALDLGQFDVVLFIDSMEHVVSPPSVLRLAWNYTKPQGVCFFSTVGWYHHHGAHMPMIPWVNLFFSDETILNVMRWTVTRPGYQPTRFDSDPPIERWRGICNLRDRPGEHLNKITVAEIRRLVKYSIFSKGQMKLVGFSSPYLRILNALRHVPILREAFHSMVVVRLDK